MMLPRFAAASWLATAATMWFAAVSPAQVIGINFNGSGAGGPGTRPGPYDLAPTEVAGALPQANWNNAPSTNGTTSNLILSTGAATTASVQASGSNNPWSLPDPVPFTTDGTLMRGYLDSSSTSTTTVSVSGLPAAFANSRYNVWVYFDGDNGGDNRVSSFTLGGQTLFGQDPANTNFNGTFVQVPSSSNTNQQGNTPAGNYLVFFGVTGASFTITTTPAFSSGTTLRAPLNALQIQVAPVPEPGSLTLLGAAAASVWWARRRSRRTVCG